MIRETDENITDYMFNEMTGEEFCTYFPNLSKKLVKLTNETECHNGFQFKTGLNEDNIPFNPKGGKFGIHFTDEDNMLKFLEYGEAVMKYYRTVKLPPDCKIYIDYGEFRANKIELGKSNKISKIPYWSDDEYCLNALRQNVRSLRYIRNINRGIQLEAIKKNAPYVIKYLLDHKMEVSKEIQIEAVKSNGYVILLLLRKKVDIPEEVQIEAVKWDNNVIRYLLSEGVEVSEEVKLETVKKNWKIAFRYLLEYGVELSNKIQLEAVKMDWSAITYLFHHKVQVSEEVKLEALRGYSLNF